MTDTLAFSDGARGALANARRQAVALQHEFIGTEHMLIGVLEADDTAVAAALDRLGLHPAVLRASILDLLKRGGVGPSGGDLPFTTRAKRVLEEAMAEARGLGSHDVDTCHLLVGLAREQGIAGQVLSHSGAHLAALRAALQPLK